MALYRPTQEETQMSLSWPSKDPDETLDYAVDWSRFLDGDTITSVTWFIVDENGDNEEISIPETVNGLTCDAYSNTDTVATIRLSDGTAGLTYRVVCQITFGASSLIASRVVRVAVREK